MKNVSPFPFTLHPRIDADSLFLTDWPLCQIRLQNVSSLPWLVMIPRRDNIREVFELSLTDQHQLISEISTLSERLSSLEKAHKMNIGALGNVVPQLHVHVIPRSTHDPAWPQPIWGNLPMTPYTPEEQSAMIARLSSILPPKTEWPASLS